MEGMHPPPDLNRCWHDTWFHWNSSAKVFLYCTLLNSRTTEIFFFKNYQWGQLTPALNTSRFFAHRALVIASLVTSQWVRCSFCACAVAMLLFDFTASWICGCKLLKHYAAAGADFARNLCGTNVQRCVVCLSYIIRFDDVTMFTQP